MSKNLLGWEAPGYARCECCYRKTSSCEVEKKRTNPAARLDDVEVAILPSCAYRAR